VSIYFGSGGESAGGTEEELEDNADPGLFIGQSLAK
jgi:hypothetical protein